MLKRCMERRFALGLMGRVAAVAVGSGMMLGACIAMVSASPFHGLPLGHNNFVATIYGGVEQADIDLHDAARAKDIPLRVYYPETGTACPVIVFSHGAGGSRSVAPDLLGFWAAAGYVVVAPTHEDSAELQHRRGEAVAMDGILRSMASPETQLRRVQDDRFIVDSLNELELLVPELAGRIDYARVGIGGHSAGAMTTMLLAGARPQASSGPRSALADVELRDERFTCALVLSGRGVGGSLTEESFGSILVPLMVMTGSLDWSEKTRQTAESRQDPYRYSPAGGKYLVFIEGAAHTSFTGRAISREEGINARWVERYLGGPEFTEIEQHDQQAIFSWVQQASLAFWDAHLKGDAVALEYLQGQGIAELGAGVITYERK
jgi:predicted dienelactone hydrolase